MEPIRLLDEQGRLEGDPPLGPEEVRRLFGAMIEARAYDRKASAMQRQGRLATYAPLEGQEATQIGSVAALQPDDWLVATYRDAGAMWLHGYTWRNLFLGRMGDERGGHPPEGVPVLPPSITVGGHMIHAVGLGWAAALRGESRISLTLFGDGATSEGDFHEAMNFAGVFETPTVFVCQNNHYAISMARSRQTAAETIAGKADGYGMPGVLVDGNDVLAVYAATIEAADRARSGGGPTLVEALTYRTGPHTTTDDHLRYRSAEEVDEWRRRDPIDRVRRYLERVDAWDPDWEETLHAAGSAAVEQAVVEAEAVAAFEPDDIFTGMYAEPTTPLRRQAEELRRDLGE
jgi:pyruvate dehydrogenase E1 component alpha subunit